MFEVSLIKVVWHFLGEYGMFFRENLEGLSAKIFALQGLKKDYDGLPILWAVPVCFGDWYVLGSTGTAQVFHLPD